jgi:hypothetical protein
MYFQSTFHSFSSLISKTPSLFSCFDELDLQRSGSLSGGLLL